MAQSQYLVQRPSRIQANRTQRYSRFLGSLSMDSLFSTMLFKEGCYRCISSLPPSFLMSWVTHWLTSVSKCIWISGCPTSVGRSLSALKPDWDCGLDLAPPFKVWSRHASQCGPRDPSNGLLKLSLPVVSVFTPSSFFFESEDTSDGDSVWIRPFAFGSFCGKRNGRRKALDVRS